MAELFPEQKRKVRKPLLWIGITSIVMTFAGLTSGYVVSRSALLAESKWLEFALPQTFYIATAVILLSSLAMVWAKRSVKSGNISQVKTGVGIALVLGIVFAVLQALGWKDLIDNGYYFTGANSNTAVSWVYVISGLHWLHVISGIIVLGVTFINASKNVYTKEEHLGLELSSIYWHFLDILWIYLFCFLVFIR
jgi:cytochrome c oxidase subunit 3